jgi:hypothetical protein
MGRNPEFSEITRLISDEASSWMDEVIVTITFLKMYRFNVQNWLLKFILLLQVINNRANKIRNPFFEAKKMAFFGPNWC